MQVEVRVNGKLELYIVKPEGPVQQAAMTVMREAIDSGRVIKLEIAADGIALVLENP
jgi:hypothetical protein